MDLLKSLLEQLLSERDVFSWNCHQSNKIVLTIKFDLSPDERRHLENLGLTTVEFDSDSVTTYKKKSRYQIERDARRSFNLIKKHTGNSQSSLQSYQHEQFSRQKDSSSSEQPQKRNATLSASPPEALPRGGNFSAVTEPEPKPDAVPKRLVESKTSGPVEPKNPRKRNASTSSSASSPELHPRGGNSSIVTEHAYSTPMPGPKTDAVPKRPVEPKVESSPRTVEDALAEVLAAIESQTSDVRASTQRLDNYVKEKASGKCFYCNEMIPSSPFENSDSHLFCSDLCLQLYDADHPSRSGSMNSSLSDVKPPD